jgi:hypothetical protein
MNAARAVPAQITEVHGNGAATTGRCIDLVGDDMDQGESTAEAPAAKPNAADGMVQMARMVPKWFWKTMGCVVVAAALCMAARFLTEPGSLPRLAAALALLAASSVAVVFAQLWAFFYAVTESDKLGIGDILMRPVTVWSATFRDIDNPGVWRRFGIIAFGLTALILTLTVVRGVAWERIWELGPLEPPKQALLDSIENVGKKRPAPAAPPETAAKPRKSADCVVLGYIPYAGVAPRTGENSIDFEALVIATEIKDQLVYAGIVSEGFSDEDRKTIAQRLPQLARDKPLIATSVQAKWIQPALTCRVTFGDFSADNQMDTPVFVKLLAEIAPKKR